MNLFRFKLVLVGLFFLLAILPRLLSAKPITITITNVGDIHTSGEGFDVGSNPPDWYMTVTVNGVTQVGPIIDDQGTISPYWTFTFDLPPETANADVSLYLRDHDDPLDPNGDDVADIDPRSNDQTVEFRVEMFRGRWGLGNDWEDVSYPKHCSAGGAGSDAASICFDVSVLSTSGDLDTDGLLDSWEANGADFNNNGVIDPDENLPAIGANPRRKDLFVELDCLVNDANGNNSLADPGDHSHCPQAGAVNAVVQAFANAPVPNPNDPTGPTGIQLHVDVGALYGASNVTTVTRTGGGVSGNYGDFGSGGTLILEAGNRNTIIDFDGAAGNPGTNFYTLKSSPNNFFNANRALAFRYAIFGHQTNTRAAQNDCTSGQAEGIPGNDFYVTLGGTDANGNPCWNVDANGFSVGTLAEQAGTFMHELGHTLGLKHGGNDIINNKPNYLSVMNYNWQTCNVPSLSQSLDPSISRVGCAYSNIGPEPNGGFIEDLDETSLDECSGISQLFGFGAIDWDGDGGFEGVSCPKIQTNSAADTNNDGICISYGANGARESTIAGDDVASTASINDGPDRICNSSALNGSDDTQVTATGNTPAQDNPLKSFDDWSNISYGFRTEPNFANGISSPVQNEADPNTLRQAREYLGGVAAPNLNVTKSGPATILPGQTITWVIKTQNIGYGPALGTKLSDKLPNGVSLEFNLGTVVAGEEDSRTVEYQVPADACPMDLINTAHVTFADIVNQSFSKNGTAVTKVLDIIPPKLSISVSPNTLWPPKHSLVPIVASVTVTDNCDPNPIVRLVSIASNEADNGLGDGDTANDIQDAVFGTDDRRFHLRSERAGIGIGRIYTITYEAQDASGNKTTQQATVSVPHNK